MSQTPRSLSRSAIASALRPVPIRRIRRRPVKSALAVVAVVAVALTLVLTAALYYRAAGLMGVAAAPRPIEQATAELPPQPPLTSVRPASILIPRERRADGFDDLQREFDTTVPQLVAGQTRVEEKVDRLAQDVRALQLAQLAIEQLLGWAKGLALTLGGLVLTSVGGLVQSYWNGVQLRKQEEQGRG